MRRLTVALLAGACSFGEPAFAQEEFRLSPRSLLGVIDIAAPAISPDGSFVAFREETASVERNTYDSHWYVRRVDGTGPAVRVADGGTPLRMIAGVPEVEQPQWSSDSGWIYYRALFHGEVQVWRASRSGAAVEQVTADPADVRSFVLGQDGQSLTYTVGIDRAEIARQERREYDQGVLIDRRIPIGQGLIGSTLTMGRPTTQRFGDGWGARQDIGADALGRHRRVDLTQLLGSRAVEEATDLVRSSTGKDEEVITSATGDLAFLKWGERMRRLHLGDPADTSEGRACALTECTSGSVQSASWRPGHPEIVYTIQDRDRGYAQSLWAWDPVQNVARFIARSDGVLAGDPRGYWSTCSISSEAAVCVEAVADVPPQLIRIDLDTGVQGVIHAPNFHLLSSANPAVEFVTWSIESGETLTGYLFHPRATRTEEPAPLFITYYSCAGYLRGGLGDEWPLAALADAGIAALCINQAQTSVAAQDSVADYQVAQEAIEAIIAILEGRGLVDQSRVGMGGLSFGSEVTTWIAANSDLLAAASVTSTSATPTHFWFRALDPNYRETLRNVWGLGFPEETPDRWRQVSPVYHAERINVPYLMQMAEQEYLAAVEYFTRIVLSGTPAEMYVFPNETHLKFMPRHKLAAYERNLDWFRFWLLGQEDEEPTKADQYTRWRLMRESWQTSTVSDGLPGVAMPGL